MLKPLNMTLLLAIIVFPLHAGKIYQWVDEHGKKHFTQTPPPEKKASTVRLSIPSGSMKPVEKSNGIYCGKLLVSYRNKSYKNHKASTRMSNSLTSLETQLKRAEERLQSHINSASKTKIIKNGEYVLRNSTSYTSTKEKLTQQVNQYRCAIDWVGNSNNPDNTDNIKDNYAQARTDYEKAISQRKDICGDEPPGYNTYGPERDRYNHWEKCYRKYSEVVSTMESKFRDAKSSYIKVEK